MDKKYGASWHCALGRGFSYDVTANDKNLLFGYYGGIFGVLLYKC